MATEVIKTVKSSGGDYTSLAAFEAGEQRDLVTADEIATARCFSFTDTAFANFDGWTTDATRYINVETDGNSRHNGKWDDSKYKLEVNAATVARVFEYVHFTGLQIASSYVGSSTTCISVLIVQLTMNRCLVKLSPSAAVSSSTGISVSGPIMCTNTIIYDLDVGISMAFSSVTIDVFNVTAYNCTTGFQAISGNITLKNCLAQACVDGYSGAVLGTSTNNCSDIASDAPGSNPVTGSVSFVDVTNDDFRLDSSDTVARGAGADLSASFTDDVNGDLRSAWDIGADEFASLVVPFTAETLQELKDILTGTTIFLDTDYDYQTTGNQKNKYLRSLLSGQSFSIQEYNFRRFEVPLLNVSSSSHSQLQTWFDSRVHLKYTENRSLTPVESGFDVKITDFTITRFAKPHVHLEYEGDITLEEF